MNAAKPARTGYRVWRTTMRCMPMALVLLLILVGVARAAGCPALPPPYGGPIFDANVQIWNPAVAELVDVERRDDGLT